MNLLANIKTIFTYKTPIIKKNSFLIWEPCTHSHAEVVPGYAKYLLDLGYHVSILITPKRYEEKLFCRFEDKNIFYNQMTQTQIRRFFRKNNLENISGVLVTTIGKLRDNKNIDQAYKFFNAKADKSKIFFVEHELGSWTDKNIAKNTITLRQMNYKKIETTIVNPHYFGNFKISKKNNIINFITIGALSEKRKSSQLLIHAVEKILAKKITNFKITIIGKGKISNFPNKLRPYFDFKGKLDFDKMYDEIEKSDFILSAYEDNDFHHKYMTTKTSGTFQLVYGFLKPIIIKNNFATINGFNNENAILYYENQHYCDAFIKAINMRKEEYVKIQNNLKTYVDSLCLNSKENLKNLINRKTK